MHMHGYEFYLGLFNSLSLRYQVEHKKIKIIATRRRAIFCLLYKHSNKHIFNNFLKISDHFPKFSEHFSKLFRRLDKCLRTFSKVCLRFLNINEDFQGG